ncbi:MAG: NAD(P)H-dependent oxidoreductase [Chitinophagaceae bacterium]|nr:NAD(P)H-dependent oxidoreductase [Chitinophagaceae bacterium]
MARILLLFAHPALEKSRVHAAMLKRVQQITDITINDLYQQYPFFDIDIQREQELLLSNDIFVFQHPLYWYSSPAIVKQWQDLVLEHGWAYGKNGRMLEGKKIFHVITSGGRAESYNKEGYNAYSIQDFLRPVERTARLCRMEYWPPYVIHGTHRMNEADINIQSIQYAALLSALRDEKIDMKETESINYLNELLPIRKSIET